MRKAGEVTFVDAHRTNKNEGWVEFPCPVGPRSGLYSFVIFRTKTFGLIARWPMFVMGLRKEETTSGLSNNKPTFSVNKKKKCFALLENKLNKPWIEWLLLWHGACWLNAIWFYRVVEFASHSDMKNAIDKLDGTDLNGRKLKLSEDRKSRLVSPFPIAT
jgi:hypothetical protein